MKLIIANMVI